ncbi:MULTISPECIES: sigma-70 family RNA polymerase sigma factor [Paenibacillus]|uniref:Sigma-70 family RNA polymerase sigma factor n=2 Tax=Paenibacillus TaxID=44249 RepID=A0A7Y6BS55_9BACL|nr:MULTISPECIES: sigma-70 family RNA polymerase sigma factor [Paenibacillus]KGP77464.1 hypothetical protein P363_0133325 [Paenibacillus sp. MAEPY1]KGP78421.1 hypothetical protein P364_0128690 [Paenibacillus sp. MAEPY2]MDN4604026.1 sigma-70 family RNA polymerase sigma factor [Paenibacillus vandeheii]NUU73952.1 sigma-70 family RNA polymerase sigma factor [Paenibacillus xylanilyticus]
MTKEQCRSELKKMAWRLQYRSKVTANKEFGMVFDITTIDSFENDSISRIHVEEIFALIPSDVGKKVIHDVYLCGKSEKEVSADLQISQQGVNKWKKKTLSFLSTKLSS